MIKLKITYAGWPMVFGFIYILFLRYVINNIVNRKRLDIDNDLMEQYKKLPKYNLLFHCLQIGEA